MLIGIVGLGLIGGSFAKVYSHAGHTVCAMDTDTQTLRYALLKGMADRELTSDDLKDCDMVLICTYPEAAVRFLEKYAPYFGEKTVVMDCCGTKRTVVEAGMAFSKKYGFTYVGGHPMAGTQYSGIKYSRSNMFKNTQMVIVPMVYNDIFLLDKIKKLLMPCGFSQLIVTTADEHDRMIAYTSQLAHIVANAYIKSPAVKEHKIMAAGSYRDMTRVAWLNPEMWTELCIDNRDNLIRETDILIENLKAYRRALSERDAKQLKALFAEGTRIKEKVEGEKHADSESECIAKL